jgi:CRP-like cAMP-binding protein
MAPEGPLTTPTNNAARSVWESAFTPAKPGANPQSGDPRSIAKAPQRSLTLCELFSGIDPSVRGALEQQCAWQWWPKGAMAIDLGATGANVYFVTSGRCHVSIGTPQGKRRVVVDEIGPGGFFGEMAAIDGEPRSASVTALERTLTAEIDGETFLRFVTAHPAAALLLMQRLTEVIRQADKTILELSTLDAQTRVYLELLRCARGGGALPPNVAVISPVPRHHEIAARASTVRETVARVLSRLQRRKLLTRERERLRIDDVAALTELAKGGA